MNQGVSFDMKNKFRMAGFGNFHSSPFDVLFNDWHSKINSETVFPKFTPEHELNQLANLEKRHVDIDGSVYHGTKVSQGMVHSDIVKLHHVKKQIKTSDKLKVKTHKELLHCKEKYKTKPNLSENNFNSSSKPLRVCRCTYKELTKDKSKDDKLKENVKSTASNPGEFPKIERSCNLHVKLANYILHQQKSTPIIANPLNKTLTSSYIPNQDLIYKTPNFPIINSTLPFNGHRKPELNLMSRYPNLIDPYFTLSYSKHQMKSPFASIYNDNSLFRTPPNKPMKLPFEIDPLEAEKMRNNFNSNISLKPTNLLLNGTNNKHKKSETVPDYRIDTVMKTQYRSRVV